jgi:hypothetical protein
MRRTTICSVIGAAAFVMSCGVAYAGDLNTIVIKQDNTLGIGLNSLIADQSGATGSLIAGAKPNSGNTLSLSDTATQTGGNNTAELTIKDAYGATGGQIGLLQSNTTGLGGGLNSAIVSVVGGGLGLVSQTGGDNTANLTVDGIGASGSIYQNGIGNSAGLTVRGHDAKGSTVQNGDNSNINLLVSGTGTSASYTINGSNVTSISPGGVQVISNGATVTITQTAFP